MNEQQKSYQIIPEGESRCVWMSAGILNYQLCNRKFDCDACPLDIAIRQHFQPPGTERRQETPAAQQDKEETTLREQYGYTTTHFWVKSISGSLYRVGIEPGLARTLMIPRTVVLPSTGEIIKASQPCLWFVLDEKTLPFNAFSDGIVATQNSLLAERPYKIYYHPYDQGWLFDMKLGKSTPPPKFLTASRAQDLYAQDQQIFRDRISEAIQTTSAGLTLPDGGQLLQALPAMLGPKRYFDIVWEVFLKKNIKPNR